MKTIFGIVLAVLILGAGGYILFQKNEHIIITTAAKTAIDYLPAPEGQEEEMRALTEIAKAFLASDDRTYRIFVLLQNNFELRPTGGFLGQFAVMEIRNGRVTQMEIVDANRFDKSIKSDRPALPPLAKYMGIKKWKFRDANFSPDFPTAVRDVLHFYGLNPQSNPQFDAVVALNATLLNDLIAVTGPITVTAKSRQRGSYTVTFTPEDAAWQLQEAVEKDILLRDAAVERAEAEAERLGKKYTEPRDENGKKIRRVRPWERVQRKQVMKDLGAEIVHRLTAPQKLPQTIPALIHFVLEGLERKDIQLFLADERLQSIAREHHWTGEVDTEWTGDYLFVVDANLGSLKSDRYITRVIEHTVDFRGRGAVVNDAAAGRMIRYRTADLKEKIMSGSYRAPHALATTRVTYTHTAKSEDWDTKDYHSYTRMIVPRGSRWITREWFFPPSADTETFANRTVYAYKFDVLIGERPVLPTMLQYVLPTSITPENYRFKIQKQSGIADTPFTLTVILPDGTRYTYHTDALRHDTELTLEDLTRE